jgi:hypothetical protein
VKMDSVGISQGRDVGMMVAVRQPPYKMVFGIDDAKDFRLL